MTLALWLLLYTVAVLVAAPRLLPALTSNGAAPRLGAAAWLTAIGTVLGSWLAAAVMLVVEVVDRKAHPRIVIASCLARLQNIVSGDAGIAPRIMLIVIASVVMLAAAITGVRLVRAALRLRARAHDHARAVRLVGLRTGEADVVMVEAAKPAAYCVAGRPPAIVVTSAARAALNDGQLAAVLAHERAHLTGHHGLIVAALRSLAAVFPRLGLMTVGAQHVSGLLEMCADDAAARRHSRRALLSGLITLVAAAPNEALAAADVAVLARAERLATPPQESTKVKTRVALVGVMAALVAAPLTAAAIAQPLKALGNSGSRRDIPMMMDQGHWGWGWGWGGWILTTGITVIFWALVITAVVLVARYLMSLSQRPTATRTAGVSGAEQVLAERYARGEIDDDEYERRLALLRKNLASTGST
jgi:uncharacterized membrane protein